MTLALARKYRPRAFSEVAVQSHVSETLKGALARGRVAHGYLLCGPRGVGKTTLARVLAMALNCERRKPDDGEPCGECDSCRRIWSGAASLDVVEIDAASNRGVDDARELRERAMYAPSGEERYKVYIVDEAHMLTREAWNALLKILEEPPPRVVFVFATTEPQKIAQSAAPVLSRLQRFDFKRMGLGDIRARLETVLAAERVESEPEALAMLARAADGSMRDALSLADQSLALGEGRLTAERVRSALGLVAEDEFLGMLDIIAERRAGDVFAAVGRLADAGADFGLLLTGLADMMRAQLAVELGGDPPEVSERARHELETRQGRLQAADLLRMLSTIGEMEPRFRKSGQQQLLLETMLVRFALLERSVDLEQLLRHLDASGGDPPRRRASGSDPAPASRRKAEAAGDARGVARDAAPAQRAGTGAVEIPAARPRGGQSEPRAERAAATAVVERPSAAALADRPPVRPSGAIAVDINRLSERWDAIVDRVRDSGRAALAGVLQHTLPLTVASGVVTLQLDEPSDFFADAFRTGEPELRAVIGEIFSGVERVVLRMPDAGAAAAPARRMTEESMRAERLASLRKRDPVLDAAVDALDLELMD